MRLARLGEWLQRTHPDLNGIERDFVEAAERLADYEQTEAERRARRQVRVNRRLRGLTAGVAVLAAVAVVTGALGIRQARRADHEAELARSHELAASAIGIVDDDPTVGKLLAVAAAVVGPSTLAADAALHETIAADHTVARWGFTGEVGVLKGALNPAGDRLAAAGVFQSDGTGWTVHIVNPYTDEEAWQVDLSTSGAASAFVTNPFFTADGRYVVAGSYWDPYGWRRMPIPFEGVDEPIVDLVGANVWDAASGARVERIDLGRCGGAVTALTDEYVLARTLHGSPDVLRDCRWRDGSVGVELIDRRSGERQVLTTGSGGFWDWGAAMSGDGSEVAYDDGATGEIVVIDVATGVELLRASGSGVRDLSPDGSFVLVGDQPVEVWDVATGQPMSEFDGHHGPSTFARFGPVGDTVYSTGDDGVLREWEATNGRERASYPAVGSGPVSVNSSGLVAVSNPDQQYVTIIDTERRGELGAIDTCEGPPVSDTLEVVARSAVVHEMCSGARSSTAYVVDLDAGRPSASVADRESGALALSPNGDRFVDQDVTGTADGEAASAALTVRDVGTGDQLLALDALPGHDAWPFAARVQWSSDGRMIAAAMGTEVAVWDAETGTLLNTASSASDDIAVNDVLFTPDSEAVVATTSDRRIVRRSLDDWDSAVERDISIIDGTYSTGLVGFAGSSVVVIGGFQGNASSTLSWLDSKTFEVQHSLSNIHEGSVLAADLDRTAGLIATAASDGSAKVWDATTGELVHEITGDGSPIRGIAFDGDRRLLVAPNSGGLEVITIDSVELLDLARQSLTKGFSAADCDHFNFADACPTLSELRNQRATDDTIVGSYRATLRVDDLVDTIQDYSLSVYGEQLIAGVAEEFASSFAGAYTVTFESGRFDITKDSAADPVCSGTYSVLGDHVWMRSERGVQCYPIKLLDGTFELTDDALVIESADLHAEDPWWLVFASRPLERI